MLSAYTWPAVLFSSINLAAARLATRCIGDFQRASRPSGAAWRLGGHVRHSGWNAAFHDIARLIIGVASASEDRGNDDLTGRRAVLA